MADELSVTQSENKEMAAAIKAVTADKALRPVYEAMKDIHANLVGNEILGRYDLGTYFAGVLKPEGEGSEGAEGDEEGKKKSTYGQSAAGTLAAALNIRVAWLYSCKRVADTWTRDEIEKIAGRASKQGKRIQWSYLDECTNGRLTKKDRLQLVGRFFNEGLRVEDIKAIIQAKLGVKAGNRGDGARSSLAPRSPQAALRQLHKATRVLIEKNDSWSTMFFDKIEQRPDDYADADLIAEITAALEEQRQLEEVASANKRRLQNVLVQTQQALAGQDNAARTPPRSDAAPAPKKATKPAAAPPTATKPVAKPAPKVGEPEPAAAKPKHKVIIRDGKRLVLKKKVRTPGDAIAAARQQSKTKREPISAA